MECYSAIKRNEIVSFVETWMNPESIIQSEVKSEREKQISYINAYMWNLEKWYVLSCFSHVQLFVTLWTVACQAPLSMGFSRREHWSGLPCPPPGDLPGPGIEPKSPVFPASAGGLFTTGATWEAPFRRVT